MSKPMAVNLLDVAEQFPTLANRENNVDIYLSKPMSDYQITKRKSTKYEQENCINEVYEATLNTIKVCQKH